MAGPILAALSLRKSHRNRWDSPNNAGDTSAFAAAGFQFDASIVMTATAVHGPPKLNIACTISPLTDWDEWMAMDLAINAAQPEAER